MGLISYFSVNEQERNERDAKISIPDIFRATFRPVCCVPFMAKTTSIFLGADKPCYCCREEMLLALYETF